MDYLKKGQNNNKKLQSLWGYTTPQFNGRSWRQFEFYLVYTTTFGGQIINTLVNHDIFFELLIKIVTRFISVYVSAPSTFSKPGKVGNVGDTNQPSTISSYRVLYRGIPKESRGKSRHQSFKWATTRSGGWRRWPPLHTHRWKWTGECA